MNDAPSSAVTDIDSRVLLNRLSPVVLVKSATSSVIGATALRRPGNIRFRNMKPASRAKQRTARTAIRLRYRDVFFEAGLAGAAGPMVGVGSTVSRTVRSSLTLG